MTDREFLNRCEQLAARARENGNSPVGCVIVQAGVIIAEGIESATSDQNITHHAEMKAIQMARNKQGKDLSKAVLYSTHEPCVMCAYSIRYHGISKVVFRNRVANLGSYTSNLNLLKTKDVPKNWHPAPEVVHLPES